MKSTKPAELRKLSLPELQEKAVALRQQIFKLRLQQSQRQLAKTADLSVTRRDLARVLTVTEEVRRQSAAGGKA